MHDYVQEELKLLGLTSARLINETKGRYFVRVCCELVTICSKRSKLFSIGEGSQTQIAPRAK